MHRYVVACLFFFLVQTLLLYQHLRYHHPGDDGVEVEGSSALRVSEPNGELGVVLDGEALRTLHFCAPPEVEE